MRQNSALQSYNIEDIENLTLNWESSRFSSAFVKIFRLKIRRLKSSITWIRAVVYSETRKYIIERDSTWFSVIYRTTDPCSFIPLIFEARLRSYVSVALSFISSDITRRLINTRCQLSDFAASFLPSYRAHHRREGPITQGWIIA